MFSILFFDILETKESDDVPDKLSLRDLLVVRHLAVEHFVNIPLYLFNEIRTAIPLQKAVGPFWRMYFF